MSVHQPERRSAGSTAGLRVAHLIETDGPGGAERIVAQIARTLQETGIGNVVFLPQRGEGWLARQLEGSGVDIDYFHLDRPFSPRCARLLAESFRRHRIAVAHSHEFSMAIYGAWAAGRAGIPHVITMHGRRYYLDRLARRVALRAAMAASARIVAVSHQFARTLARDLALRRRRIETITNGVADDRPAAVTLRAELDLDHRHALVVAVGNLYKVKGHRHLIDAVALLADRHPHLHVA